jgi:hypothetical protein
VGEQIRNPLGIGDIALAPGHVLDLARIGEHQREVSLENVPDRLPVDARRLHRHMRDVLLL